MPDPDQEPPQNDLGPAIIALGTAMRDLGGVLIGGVAISLTTRPRYTTDVDAVVKADSFKAESLFVALEPYGFGFREGGSLEFARVNAVLLLKHMGSGVPVDVALG